jgi:hypothetical protein
MHFTHQYRVSLAGPIETESCGESRLRPSLWHRFARSSSITTLLSHVLPCPVIRALFAQQE